MVRRVAKENRYRLAIGETGDVDRKISIESLYNL